MSTPELIEALVDRFLAWRVPESACADLCATRHGLAGRSGTNFFTADEARQLFEYLMPVIAARDAEIAEAARREERERCAKIARREKFESASPSWNCACEEVAERIEEMNRP